MRSKSNAKGSPGTAFGGAWLGMEARATVAEAIERNGVDRTVVILRALADKDRPAKVRAATVAAAGALAALADPVKGGYPAVIEAIVRGLVDPLFVKTADKMTHEDRIEWIRSWLTSREAAVADGERAITCRVVRERRSLRRGRKATGARRGR